MLTMRPPSSNMHTQKSWVWASRSCIMQQCMQQASAHLLAAGPHGCPLQLPGWAAQPLGTRQHSALLRPGPKRACCARCAPPTPALFHRLSPRPATGPMHALPRCAPAKQHQALIQCQSPADSAGIAAWHCKMRQYHLCFLQCCRWLLSMQNIVQKGDGNMRA
jgi:hypothetical protein